MQVNFDFDERVVLETEQMESVQLRLAGLGRWVLGRQAAGLGRATSVVRYELEGFFCDPYPKRC